MRLRSRSSNARGEMSSNTNAPTASRSVLGDVSNRTRQKKDPNDKDASNAKPMKNHTTTVGASKSSTTKQDATVTVREENDENNIGIELRRSRRFRNNTRATTRAIARIKRKHSPQPDEERKKKSTNPTSVNDSIRKFDLPPPESEESMTVEEEREEVLPQALDTTAVLETFRLHRPSFNGKTLTSGIAQHDKENIHDVLQVTNYVSDLYQHLYAEESLSCPTMYMSRQDDINSKMRAILIDWLIEVHMKFRLEPDTLYLCVNIIDRYCNIVKVRRNKLQLVGVTALLIACKYEEIYPPEVRDCVYITDRAYRREEVLGMEHEILDKLNYRISVPTAYPFLLRFLNITKASPLAKNAANYYMERTLQEHELLRFRPSLLSAASVMLALSNPDIEQKGSVIDGDTMSGMKLLLNFTGFSIHDICACSALMAVKIGEEPVTASNRQLNTVKKKYDSRRYLHVSRTVTLPHPSNIAQFVEERE